MPLWSPLTQVYCRIAHPLVSSARTSSLSWSASRSTTGTTASAGCTASGLSLHLPAREAGNITCGVCIIGLCVALLAAKTVLLVLLVALVALLATVAIAGVAVWLGNCVIELNVEEVGLLLTSGDLTVLTL